MRTDVIFLCTVICVSVAQAFPFVPNNAEVLRQNYRDISELPRDSKSSDSDFKVLFLYPNSLKESHPTDKGLDRNVFSPTREKRYLESMHSLVPRLMSNAVHAVRGKRIDGNDVLDMEREREYTALLRKLVDLRNQEMSQSNEGDFMEKRQYGFHAVRGKRDAPW
ncbi:hypothetical protein CHS0354_033378 [Potamilus streckersoni]|uniref:Uncharacterized protein n=1 Tax=Potamilus streckersoni TaxID=2493646 RepID=A0AAE0VI99_9BIVA|nr:hypothetical protein CHS0354_033378 [Potamilus streckersoni]